MCFLDSDKREDLSGTQDIHAAGPWDAWGVGQKNKRENIKAIQGKENGFIIKKKLYLALTLLVVLVSHP